MMLTLAIAVLAIVIFVTTARLLDDLMIAALVTFVFCGSAFLGHSIRAKSLENKKNLADCEANGRKHYECVAMLGDY